MQASQKRKLPGSLFSKALTWFIAMVVALPIFLVPQQAPAQQRETLFEWLFGPKQPAPRSVPDQRRRPDAKPKPRKRNSDVQRSKNNQSTPGIVKKRTAAPEPVAKLDNATTILVAGDFLAKSLGDGLTTGFQTNAGIRIVTKANGSSGMVRDDFYNWLARLPEFMTEAKPNIAVVMIGANDRQMILRASADVKFGSDEWFAEYERRLTALGAIAQRNGSKLLWVGLPSFQSTNFTADVLVLNRIYRKVAEKAGAEFIDIWDGFADESGKFITTGFDVNGQQARLREADGIALTAAGREKLAFYVERAIRRYTEDLAPSTANLDGVNLPALSSLPDLGVSASAIRTQPINVTDPDLDGGKELLGAKPMPLQIAETPRQRLIKRGEMDEAPLGRIDDYRRSEDAVAAVNNTSQ